MRNPARMIQHRELIAQMIVREIAQRYRGSMLGMGWSLLQPLLLLTVYTFIFSVVFRARWPANLGEGTANFAIVIFTGLITFSIFAETVNAAPRLILTNRNLVRRSVFPLEILPLVKATSALVQALFSLMVLIAGLMLVGGELHWSALMLPLVWLPTGFFALGIAYLLSAAGVFLRDLDQVVGVFVTALFFGSAIFYPISQVPEPARRILEWVPTAVFVEDARRLLLYGDVSIRPQTVVLAAASVGIFYLGYAWFMRSKKAFADVL